MHIQKVYNPDSTKTTPVYTLNIVIIIQSQVVRVS